MSAPILALFECISLPRNMGGWQCALGLGSEVARSERRAWVCRGPGEKFISVPKIKVLLKENTRVAKSATRQGWSLSLFN